MGFAFKIFKSIKVWSTVEGYFHQDKEKLSKTLLYNRSSKWVTLCVVNLVTIGHKARWQCTGHSQHSIHNGLSLSTEETCSGYKPVVWAYFSKPSDNRATLEHQKYIRKSKTETWSFYGLELCQVLCLFLFRD